MYLRPHYSSSLKRFGAVIYIQFPRGACLVYVLVNDNCSSTKVEEQDFVVALSFLYDVLRSS
jgi:hypothetical protein